MVIFPRVLSGHCLLVLCLFFAFSSTFSSARCWVLSNGDRRPPDQPTPAESDFPASLRPFQPSSCVDFLKKAHHQTPHCHPIVQASNLPASQVFPFPSSFCSNSLGNFIPVITAIGIFLQARSKHLLCDSALRCLRNHFFYLQNIFFSKRLSHLTYDE